MTTQALLALVVVALTTATFWAMPALGRPTLPFGVRVPSRHVTEPAIVRARRRYARGVVLLGVLTCAAVVVASLGFRREPRLDVVLVAVIAVCCALGYHAHRSVAAAKRTGDWYAGTRQAVTADTSLRTDPVRPQWILLAPAVAILLITAGIGASFYSALPATLPTPNGVTVDAARRSETTFGFAFATVTAQLLIILTIMVVAIALPRARPELDAERPAGSAAQYRTYLRGIVRLLLVSAGCANATLLVTSLQVWEILPPTALVTLAGYAPLAAVLVAWAIFAIRAGDAGHRLPTADGETENSGYVQRDDDRYWYAAGMIYLNRRDPAVLVHRRTGGFWTLNLGNPISWAILAVIAVFALLSGFGVIDLPRRGG